MCCDQVTNLYQVIVAIVIIIAACMVTYSYLRRKRLAGRPAPKFLPKKLKQKWERWQPKKKYTSVDLVERGDLGSSNRRSSAQAASATNTTAGGAGVDRNTSVRSVMTLPAYSQTPKESEQVLGREGERGGMDTVIEFPETQEQEEEQREQEMESLYQIRQARRREIAEREERRRERREARERGDMARLDELRREARQQQTAQNQSTGNLTADILIAEHQSRPKERRISSVAYAEVGQVRHDGTRLRANSHESERGGLLEGAAPMGEEGHGRSNSDAAFFLTLDNLSRPSLPFAGRQRADSGAMSVSTTSSFDFPEPTPGTVDGESRRNSLGDHGRSETTSDGPSSAVRLTPSSTDGGSNGNENGVPRPPEYDDLDWGDAPTYEEALRRRESQRSARLAVPTINIHLASEPNSPNLTRVSEDNERVR